MINKKSVKLFLLLSIVFNLNSMETQQNVSKNKISSVNKILKSVSAIIPSTVIVGIVLSAIFGKKETFEPCFKLTKSDR